eukprot:4509763-Amphidinium_carterae.1
MPRHPRPFVFRTVFSASLFCGMVWSVMWRIGYDFFACLLLVCVCVVLTVEKEYSYLWAFVLRYSAQRAPADFTVAFGA